VAPATDPATPSTATSATTGTTEWRNGVEPERDGMERHGFAEPAPARSDGRERPWRATLRSPQVDLDPTTPAGSAAAAAVAGAFFDRTRAVAEEFISTEHDEPEEWRDVAALANADLWLTAEEHRQVTKAFAGVLEPYRDRTLDERPEHSRRVRVMTLAVPYRKP